MKVCKCKREILFFVKFLFLFTVFCGKVLKLEEKGNSEGGDFQRRIICGKHLTKF